MGLTYNVDVEGDGLNRFLRTLFELGQRAGNARTAMEAVADDFLRLEGQIFARRGASSGGTRWTPLASAYLENRRKAGRGSSILELQGGKGGRLRRSLTEKGAPYQVRRVTSDDAELGTKLSIARIHQSGGTFNGRRIPARPFVRLSNDDKDRWVMIMRTYIVDGNVGPDTFRFGL